MQKKCLEVKMKLCICVIVFGIAFGASTTISAQSTNVRVKEVELKTKKKTNSIKTDLTRKRLKTITVKEFNKVLENQVQIYDKDDLVILEEKNRILLEEIKFENAVIELYSNGESEITITEATDIENRNARAAYKKKRVQSTRYRYNGFNQAMIKYFVVGIWEYNGKSVRYVKGSGSSTVTPYMITRVDNKAQLNYTLSNGTKGLCVYGTASTFSVFGERWGYDLRIAVNKNGGYSATYKEY